MEESKTTPQQLPPEYRRIQDDMWTRLKSNGVKLWRFTFEIIVIVLLVANLGSLNQLYKAINTLTEFNANAIMHPKIYQGAAPNSSPPASSPPPTHKK